MNNIDHLISRSLEPFETEQDWIQFQKMFSSTEREIAVLEMDEGSHLFGNQEETPSTESKPKDT